MTTYTMTTIETGTRLRDKTPSTFSPVIQSFPAGTVVSGDQKFVAPADGNEVLKGDTWIWVTSAPGLIKPGWMAYIHKGIKICTNFKESIPLPEPTPTPTPAPILYPQSFIQELPDGTRIKYVFDRVL